MKGNKNMKTITKSIYAAFASVLLGIGALTATGATGDLFTSVDGNGSNGGGFIYQYRPSGLQRILASGLSRPRGVAFGHGGSLFVVTTTLDAVTGTFQESIVKITPNGVQNTVATLSGDFFGEGVTVSRAGNLFVMAINNSDPNLASIIYKITPDGTQSAVGTTPGQSFGLAFDRSGNLFAADFSDQTIYQFAPDGTQTIFEGPSAFQPGGGPLDLAFDAVGNLFVSEGADPTGRILEFTPDGVETEFATEVQPRGLAFDTSGNLFADDIAAGEILKFTPDGNRTVFASGIATPEFLTFQQ
jgi:sugar lactone lactonase YvrE